MQEETDERVVELQNMIQGVTQAEAEIQQMLSLLQDLETSMNNTKQRQEEVPSTPIVMTFISLFLWLIEWLNLRARS